MRKIIPIRALAIVALAGSAVGGTVLATSGGAGAAKAPVAANCGSVNGSGTVSGVTSGAALLSTVSGCTSTDTKVTSNALDVSTVNSDLTTGSGTITFTNGKAMTYTFSIATSTAFSCPTFLGTAATEKETITITATGGNAHVTANGGFNVCAYVGSDNTIYEASNGPVTL